MLEYGFYYVPEYCSKNSCNLHMFFHGCMQPAESTLELYAPWAAANNIVIIAPQADICWAVHEDYDRTKTSNYPNYFTKEDPQYKFVMNLINVAK